MKNMLILDADRDYTSVIADRCEPLGIVATRTENAVSATAAVNLDTPDIICVDLTGSELDGLTFCEYLAWNSETNRIPTIIMTSHQDIDSMQRCCTLENAFFVEKSAQCWESIYGILETHGLTAEARANN